jgi:hypothetical protein
MTEPYSQVLQLQWKASELPHGPAQVALLEEAVQLADSINDVVLAFRVRNDLMTAATFSGRPDIMLVAFSWCLAQYDRNPEQFYSHDLLWKYKWVLGNAFKFSEINRTRVEALLADMERRYQEAGSTMHAVATSRRDLFAHFGEWPQARAAHADLRKLRRDSLSDCPACLANSGCDYYCGQGQWGRAVQAARPVLHNRLSCAEEPHRTLGLVLLPLLHLGRLDEAKAYQRQGWQLVGQAAQFVREHANHLRFLVLTGGLPQAKRVLERHLPGALESVLADERFQFLLAVRLWTDRLAGRGTRELKVRLPKGLPAADGDGKSDVGALGEWFTARAREIAQRFDARNGTTTFQEQIDELPELLRLAAD